MDELEKILFEQRDEIQNEEPHEGHFERFEMKLNTSQKSKTGLRFIQFAGGIAAILVVALLAYNYSKSQSDTISLRQVAAEYEEVEDYYVQTINYEEAKLEDYFEQNNTDVVMQKMLNNEIKTFDNQYQQLCVEMKLNPGDERIVNAMIEYYQAKLGVITQILLKLEANKETTDNHENNENIKL